MENIYSLLSATTSGQVGNNANFIRNKCEICKFLMESYYQPISIELDSWAGEDLIYCHTSFIISERLKLALETENLKGAFFQLIEVFKASYFKILPQAYTQELPNFYQIITDTIIQENPIWYETILCDKCDKTKIKRNENIANQITNLVSYNGCNPEDIPKRQLIFQSWNKEDFFYADIYKRYPIIVTEKVLNIIKEVNSKFMKDVKFTMEIWVDINNKNDLILSNGKMIEQKEEITEIIIPILSPEPLKLLSPSSPYNLPPEVTQIEVFEPLQDRKQNLTATLFSYYLENEKKIPYKIENIKIEFSSTNKSKKLYTFENLEPFMLIINDKAVHFPKKMKIVIKQEDVRVVL